MISIRVRSVGNVDPSCSGGGGHLGYAVEVDGPTHFCLEASPPLKNNSLVDCVWLSPVERML